MSSVKYTPVSVTEQPQACTNAMDATRVSFEKCEKDSGTHSHQGQHACHQCQDRPTEHRGCHKSRLRRMLLPAIVAFVLLAGFLAMGCIGGDDIAEWGTELLGKRAVGGTTSSTGGTFKNKKLYLIIIFVGLLVVVILAVMLSAWCCKGAFKNPLCCPCYLCACCGGLACLECIGCGLCAEGLDIA